MNIFDIPELTLTDDERIKVTELLMFDHANKIDFSGLSFYPYEEQSDFGIFTKELAYRLFKTIPSDVMGVAVEAGKGVKVHTDDYSGDVGLSKEEMDHWDTLPFNKRKSIVCFPLTPKDNYTKLFYPHTQESHGWSDHAFAFNTFAPHGVDHTDVFRLNLQFTFDLDFEDLYQLYKSGELLNEHI